MKIVVLNDLHPDDFPGAATVAHKLALESSRIVETQYWSIRSRDCSSNSNQFLKYRTIIRNEEYMARKFRSSYARFFSEFFSFRELVEFCRLLREEKPTHLWVNQIGNQFPRTIIPASRIMGVKVISTIHDFGLIVPRKLFPVDIGISSESELIQIVNQKKLFLHKSPILRRFLVLYRLRKFLAVFVSNFSHAQIAISSLQFLILQKFGVRVTAVINNGASLCSCDSEALQSLRMPGSILFAGRPHAKGLDQIIQAVSRDNNFHLFLAGGAILESIVREKLPDSQFTYLGNLEQSKLFLHMHKIQYVSVLSECFDVYPSITLEAINHGAKVLTTNLTGNAHLVVELGRGTLVPFAASPDLSILQSKRQLSPQDEVNLIDRSKLKTHFEALIDYLSYFTN